MTSWGDESGTSVAEQMGPNRNCSMSLPNYSEDTFTSVTEEEGERQYEDDSFESYDPAEEWKEPAASDLTESTWQSSCQKDEGRLGSTRIWFSSFCRLTSGTGGRLRSAKTGKKAQGEKKAKEKLANFVLNSKFKKNYFANSESNITEILTIFKISLIKH